MQYLGEGFNLVSLHVAEDMFAKSAAHTLAITRDIIVALPDTARKYNGILSVYFRGNKTGTLRGKEFTPVEDNDPLSKRTYAKLFQEGYV
jgi:hypothetical protein